MIEKMTIEEILWKSILDIENGEALTINEDPINGFLKGKDKKLTKVNISNQSSKYTANGKPISRPTIDTYESITNYLHSQKENKKTSTNVINDLKAKNQSLEYKIKTLNDEIKKLAQENYKLNLKVR